MSEQCGVHQALKLIGNKWSLVVLHFLCTQPRGFNELQRLIVGISPKVLSDRLKELVEHGLANKTVFPTNPPTVEYTLTYRGHSLKPIIDSLNVWGEQLTESPSTRLLPR